MGQITLDPLGDKIATGRYEKAKEYARTLYRIHNLPVGRGHRRFRMDLVPTHYNDLASLATQEFWAKVREATPRYAKKPDGLPSQETVDVICDLIRFVEECRRSSA